MRSVLVAALLGNTGLYVPCTRACIPRYKTFFLRMSGNDIPAAGKSALAVECDDLRLLQRDCALPHSLVMVDELGKGTSSKEGAAVAGAVLEWLDQSPRITAIFSTHLHELFDMGLRLGGVQEKTIGFSEGGGGGGYGGSAGSSGDRESSTTGGSGDSGSGRTDGAEQGGQGGQGGQGQSSEHLLQDGRCTNSMALATAKQCGVDANLIQRAAQLILQQLAPLICASASSSTPESVFLTSDIVFLTYNSQPPVYLDDRPCLYVLRVQSKQAPDQLYVGETNSIHTRLEQHRQTFGKDRYFESAVLPVRGSKRAEGRLIKMLREGGFDLLNSKEGGMYCGEGE
ncbi:muts domain V-domain-containing protein [Ochromonadaceae sp. CCMP2298]|nr:muts domain V-domain-containing protein [Ochromonadaceae sp. CCMP2298]